MVVVVVVMMMTMMMVRLSFQLLPHVICILPICIILGLHIMNLIPQRLGIQIKRCPVTLPHMQRHILCSKHLLHGGLGGVHELSGEAKLAVSAEDGERGNVAVALVAFVLHLSEDVTDDAAVVVLGDVKKLRPREDVVEIVFHLVILGKAKQVASLHSQ